MYNSLKIIFAGTSHFSAYHLNALIHSNYNIIGVFTQPDSVSGRGKKLKFSPVKQLAIKYRLPIYQPISLYEEKWCTKIAMLNADIIIVVAYGLIFPEIILKIPSFGCINIHSSLLPRWRGAAPIQRTLLAGDKQTGITIIQMDSGIDTGVILYQEICDISPNDTSLSMCNKLAQIGSNALLIVLKQIITSNINIIPQHDTKQFTYAKKLTKKEGLINWHLPAVYIERCIRAFNPWPSSFFSFNGKYIKVWSSYVKTQHTSLSISSIPGTILLVETYGIHIITGDGVLVLTSLQLPGKKITSISSLMNSHPTWLNPGIILI